MVSQELLGYVKKELARGVHEDKIRQVLLEYNWPEFEINEAFEKAKEERVVEKASEELLKEIAEKEQRLQEKVEERVEKRSVVGGVKRIVMNKLFIIAAAVLIIGSVILFMFPLFFEEKVEQEVGGVSGDALSYAEGICRQYCNSNLCGLFTNPGFTHPELEGKTCRDLGFSCLQPGGEPKCETEY